MFQFVKRLPIAMFQYVEIIMPALVLLVIHDGKVSLSVYSIIFCKIKHRRIFVINITIIIIIITIAIVIINTTNVVIYIIISFFIIMIIILLLLLSSLLLSLLLWNEYLNIKRDQRSWCA